MNGETLMEDEPVYKCRSYSDGDWEVYNPNTNEQYFCGTIADCEAWIRFHTTLKEYMND